MKKTFRSIGAVVAGVITIVLLSVVTDAILENLGVFPPPTQGLFITWMLVLAFAYRSVYAVIGSYITAALAPEKPMKHSMILGVVGTVMSGLGIVYGWDLSQHWYPIALCVTTFPLVWMGAKLRERRKV